MRLVETRQTRKDKVITGQDYFISMWILAILGLTEIMCLLIFAILFRAILDTASLPILDMHGPPYFVTPNHPLLDFSFVKNHGNWHHKSNVGFFKNMNQQTNKREKSLVNQGHVALISDLPLTIFTATYIFPTHPLMPCAWPFITRPNAPDPNTTCKSTLLRGNSQGLLDNELASAPWGMSGCGRGIFGTWWFNNWGYENKNRLQSKKIILFQTAF